MKRKIVISFMFLFCCFISSTTTTCFSSPLPFPDDIFSSYSSFGRTLLDDKKLKPCPVDFNTMNNYTIITSKCKAPQYDPQICCQAFLDFACPYWSDLNDYKTNECSIQMFNKLRQYQYPEGLFKKACKECPVGVECPALPPGSEERQSVENDSNYIRSPSLLLTLAVGFIIF